VNANAFAGASSNFIADHDDDERQFLNAALRQGHLDGPLPGSGSSSGSESMMAASGSSMPPTLDRQALPRRIASERSGTSGAGGAESVNDEEEDDDDDDDDDDDVEEDEEGQEEGRAEARDDFEDHEVYP